MAIIKNILWQEEYLRLGLKIPIDWDTELAPMACCFGTTGSGKTYALKLLCGKLSKYANACLAICDGKGGGDFDFLKGCERYASVDVTAVFNKFYDRFLARQRDEDRNQDMMVLVFDEWSAYLDGCLDGSQDGENLSGRKYMEAQRMKLGRLLRQGRSFRTHVLIGQQRMDSVYFQSFRENFNIAIGLSNLSKESRDMFFSEFKEQIEPDRGRGLGYMTINGSQFTPIAVPHIRDISSLHQMIYEGVTRQF